MYATLVRTEQLAPTIRRFWFQPEKALDYVAGQFTELYLPHSSPDNRGQKRWFTISSSPTEQLFSITSRFAGERPSTFKQTLLQVTPGSRLQFAEPMGDFVLPKDPRLPLIFVAGGIGITPVHSMIKFLHDRSQQRDIRLLYIVRDSQELLFSDLFRAYGLQMTPIVTAPRQSWEESLQNIDVQQLTTQAQATPNSLLYLSGPEQLVEYLNAELQKNGVPGRRLITDFFHGYQSV